MSRYLDEVDANFEKFTTNWNRELEETRNDLQSSKTIFKESYRRITTLNAWRSIILESKISPESLAFFTEAQNDALVSHTLSQFGSWRSALKALRSCIENVIACLYYKDHLVELKLWHLGKHKLGFTEGVKYLRDHPDLLEFNDKQTGLEILVYEYGTLSRAVHASASSFRMTQGASSATLWSSQKASAGGWRKREQLTIHGLNLLLLAMYRQDLQGAMHPNLRQAISLAIPRAKYIETKDTYGVHLTYPS